MASEDKLDEARVLAGEILALSPHDTAQLYYTQMKRRKLGRLVRLLDRLLAQEGEDRRLAAMARSTSKTCPRAPTQRWSKTVAPSAPSTWRCRLRVKSSSSLAPFDAR